MRDLLLKCFAYLVAMAGEVIATWIVLFIFGILMILPCTWLMDVLEVESTYGEIVIILCLVGFWYGVWKWLFPDKAKTTE